jgi:hypothetical protein
MALFELDDAIGRTGMAGTALADSRIGRNSRYSLITQFRQSVFACLAGYESDPAPIYDHYGQTEIGMVVNKHQRLDHTIRPGSAGFAMPGFRVVVLEEARQELGPN